MTEEAYSLIAIIDKVKGWHRDRNLIDGSSDKDQFLKLIQEAGELSDNICKGKDIKDDIGDMMVVLINIAERNNLTLTECLLEAWHDIKDRKGRMVDGVFVKESDGYTVETVELTKVTIIEDGRVEPRRAVGPLDGPGFDMDENVPEAKEDIYKNTICGVTKY